MTHFKNFLNPEFSRPVSGVLMQNNTSKEICLILADVVEILRGQARELENLTKEIAQMTNHLSEERYFSMVNSQLASVKIRLDELQQQTH